MTSFSSKSRRSGGFAAKRTRGIVLILTLILLVVISSVAVLAVRNAISGEQVSNNLRVNAVATQAAETALRYCETLVMKGDATTLVQPGSAVNPMPLPSQWATRSKWVTPTVTIVPLDVINSSDSAGRTVKKAPMCMIENMSLQPIETTSAASYLITARGFSQDFQAAANGSVLAGSEVWVQSYLRY